MSDLGYAIGVFFVFLMIGCGIAVIEAIYLLYLGIKWMLGG